MAKLTTEQWAEVRTTWENDQRDGFQWLSQEIDVSRQVITRRAEKEKWQKLHAAGQGKALSKGAGKEKKGAQKGAQKRCAPAPEHGILDIPSVTNNIYFSENERTVGRPSAYQSCYAEVANKLCLAFGATDAQLAEWFGVCEKTVNTWKGAHPEFLQSIQEGKTIADANVARALYERAIGYSHPDVHIAVWQGEAIITPITKHHPPDVGAAKYWLNNRQPARWRNQMEVEVSSTVTVQSVEQLNLIYEAGMEKARQSREDMEVRRLQLEKAKEHAR